MAPPGRAAPPTGSGPLRAVPPGGGSSGPMRSVAPNGSGPLRAVPPTGGPTGSGARLRAVPPRGDVGAAREPQFGAPGRGSGPVPRTTGPWSPAGADARARATADPGPATGAWDPFSFDDEDDGVGPATVVDRNGADPRRAPRRDRLPSDPTPRGGARDNGPATQFDVTARRGDALGPAYGTGPARRDARPTASGPVNGRGDGPATSVDVHARGPGRVVGRRPPAEGPETSVNVRGRARTDGPATAANGRRPDARPGRPGGRADDGPATSVEVNHPSDGPVTQYDVTGTRGAGSGGRRRAPGRPGFAAGLRTRSGRTGATPAANSGAGTAAVPAAPGRAAPAPASGRVALPPRRPVDAPTELTDGIDGHTDVAAPRRPSLLAPPRGPVRPVDPARRGAPWRRPDDGDPQAADVDERDLDDRHLDDRFLDDRLREPDLDDPDLDDHDLDRDADDPDHDVDHEADDLADLDDEPHDDVDDDLDDDPHDDLDPDGELDEADDRDDLEEPLARPAQAWAGVVAQWLAGAVAGAVLWVLFRYLWRGLPVVALAAALLVTAGLVLLVRQLLHDVDRRTTTFAVLVGLLLTASPAVLVLLGR
jgi:hypothetical protein